MSKPTLPGTIPGLLRRASPVVGVHTGTNGIVMELSDHPDRGPGARVGETLAYSMSWAPLTAFALDLSDPTGRAHAVWWLLRRLGEASPAYRVQHHPVEVASWVGGLGWGLSHPDVHASSWLPPDYSGQTVGSFRVLECLRGLRPLRDDVEALRRVCLHEAGRMSQHPTLEAKGEP